MIAGVEECATDRRSVAAVLDGARGWTVGRGFGLLLALEGDPDDDEDDEADQRDPLNSAHSVILRQRL